MIFNRGLPRLSIMPPVKFYCYMTVVETDNVTGRQLKLACNKILEEHEQNIEFD